MATPEAIAHERKIRPTLVPACSNSFPEPRSAASVPTTVRGEGRSVGLARTWESAAQTTTMATAAEASGSSPCHARGERPVVPMIASSTYLPASAFSTYSGWTRLVRSASTFFSIFTTLCSVSMAIIFLMASREGTVSLGSKYTK